MAPKSYALTAHPSSTHIFFASQFTRTHLPPRDISLPGQTVLLTGGNVGLGYACAEWLLDLNVGRLILAVRTKSRGEAAAESLLKKYPGAKIEVWLVDMMSYKSIQDFAQKCQTLDRLDIAILNAGISADRFETGPEGHEKMTQVNYYSTALLSFLLLPILKSKSPAGKPGRLTIVSSGTAHMAKLPNKQARPFLPTFDDESLFDISEQYSASKALGHFWILKLFEKVKKEDVVVNLVDPGLCKGTSLHRNLSTAHGILFWVMKSLLGRTMRAGSSTYIDAAVVQGPESHGSYIMDWKIYP